MASLKPKMSCGRSNRRKRHERGRQRVVERRWTACLDGLHRKFRAAAGLQAEDIRRVGSKRDEPNPIVWRERQGDRLDVGFELIERAALHAAAYSRTSVTSTASASAGAALTSCRTPLSVSSKSADPSPVTAENRRLPAPARTPGLRWLETAAPSACDQRVACTRGRRQRVWRGGSWIRDEASLSRRCRHAGWPEAIPRIGYQETDKSSTDRAAAGRPACA